MPYRTTTALLLRAQSLGLSPAAAVMFVDDYPRLFGHHRFNGHLATPDDWAWRRLRDRLQRAWLAVRSAADWERLTSSPDHRAFRAEIGGLWSMFGPGDDEDDPDPHRQRMMKSGHWDGLMDVVKGHAWPASRLFGAESIGVPERPEGASARGRAAAEARLQGVLHACGLRGISWPFDEPGTPGQLHRVADLLLDAQRHLQGRTGWTGPVLGLGGRLHLSLDAHLPLSGAQAFFGWRRTDSRPGMPRNRSTLMPRVWGNVRMVMVLSLQSGMTSLAHEWFHALDSVLGITAGDNGREGVCEQWKSDAPFAARGDRSPAVHQAVAAMNAFTDRLVNGPMPEAVIRAAAEEACATWVDGWRIEDDPPHYQALQRQEDQDMRAGTWSETVSAGRWQEAVRQRCVQWGLNLAPDNEEFLYRWTCRTAMSTIQHRLRRDGGLEHPEGQPFWTTANDLLGTLQKALGLGPKWLGYTRLPHEMMAHAFESSFARPNPLIVEASSGRCTLRFPTGVEADHLAPHWAGLFEAMRPWWDEARAMMAGER